jgi:hypothetical protein
VGVKVVVIAGLASWITIVIDALQGSPAFLRTLMTRWKVGANPAGTPVIVLPAVKLVNVVPSNDHCKILPVSPATSSVRDPVEDPAQTGPITFEAMGVPTVPD